MHGRSPTRKAWEPTRFSNASTSALPFAAMISSLCRAMPRACSCLRKRPENTEAATPASGLGTMASATCCTQAAPAGCMNSSHSSTWWKCSSSMRRTACDSAFCSGERPASMSKPLRFARSSMTISVSPMRSPSSSIQGFFPLGPLAGLFSIAWRYWMPARSSHLSSLSANGPVEGRPQSPEKVNTARSDIFTPLAYRW